MWIETKIVDFLCAQVSIVIDDIYVYGHYGIPSTASSASFCGIPPDSTCQCAIFAPLKVFYSSFSPFVSSRLP